jgi:hypothetical protein
MTHESRQKKLVIISSEPLTSDNTDWYACKCPSPLNPTQTSLFASDGSWDGTRISVPENHTLVVTQDIHTFLAPIAMTPDVGETEMTASLRRIYG